MPNKLTRIAQEILFMESDLPQRFDYSSGERPEINDFEIHLFEQTWGSTALGFSGIGGQARRKHRKSSIAWSKKSLNK